MTIEEMESSVETLRPRLMLNDQRNSTEFAAVVGEVVSVHSEVYRSNEEQSSYWQTISIYLRLYLLLSLNVLQGCTRCGTWCSPGCRLLIGCWSRFGLEGTNHSNTVFPIEARKSKRMMNIYIRMQGESQHNIHEYLKEKVPHSLLVDYRTWLGIPVLNVQLYPVLMKDYDFH